MSTLGPKQSDIDAAIDAAGRESLIVNGFGRTTVAGVARVAGVSRPTVYARYRNIGEMAGNILTQELLPLAARIFPLPTSVAEFVDIVVSGANDLRKNELITAVIAHDPELLQTYQFERLGRVQTHLISLLVEALNNIEEAGSPLRNESHEVMAAIVISTVQSMAFQRETLRPIIASDETWSEQLAILLNGYLLP
ncbi:MAG: TetR family transcriptional regulator [Trueperella sp.]|nr:TetR family transcriptional regulator [Trueperella sp.]